MLFKRKKIGLALGGGGVRSISSLGVIENIERSGYKIRYISGSSMGAIAGALYCHYLDTDKVKGALHRLAKSENYKKMSKEFSKKLSLLNKEISNRDSFKVKFKKYFSTIAAFNNLRNNISLIDKSYVRPVINELIPDINIEDLNFPFCAVAADISSGKKVIFKKGNLRSVIMGSIAIPGILEPEVFKNMLLADGMVASLTPVEEARGIGSDFVIAVEVKPRLRKSTNFKSGLDILERANSIISHNLHNYILREADMVISPPVKNIYWANFDKMDYCIKAGESASLDIKSRIKHPDRD